MTHEVASPPAMPIIPLVSKTTFFHARACWNSSTSPSSTGRASIAALHKRAAYEVDEHMYRLGVYKSSFTGVEL